MTLGHRTATAADGDVHDVVIVGAGLAGLFTALKLAPMPVTVVSAARFGHGTSSGWAQGGIAAAMTDGDTPEEHAADTIRAGAGIVDAQIARLMAEEAPARIEDLLSYGVPFDKDLEGRLGLSREAAHGKRRVVRVKGDLAGRAIMAAVVAAAQRTPSIDVIEGFAAHDLLLRDARVQGVFLWPAGTSGRGGPRLLRARAIVLASGGSGQLYARATNPGSARGEGLAMAARAGAVIADAEFVQFHPTALDIGRDPAPLATEALRGEGATLITAEGERFMLGVHDDAELAPRDIVARAVFGEIAAGHRIYLDCREAVGGRIADAFPNLHEVCREAGIDPAREPLPVAPAAHYHMGGVETDADGRTSIEGLWAAGEVASTGAHGANRLASNSLLETVVFGARIAADITGLQPGRNPQSPARAAPGDASRSTTDAAGGSSIMRLREVMSRHVGVVRDRAGLIAALTEIDRMARAPDLSLPAANMLLAARFMAAAALLREESRGAHFRADFPHPKPGLAHRSRLTLERLEVLAAEASPLRAAGLAAGI